MKDNFGKNDGKQYKGISVFFPAYNDEKTIKSLVENSVLLLESITDNYEVIIIDDGSQDRTGEIADKLTLKNSKIKVVHHNCNRGYGRALKSGFSSASKELVFYTDGDGQYDVRDLSLFLSLMKDDIDMVNGYKIKRQDPLYRIIIGRVYNWIVKIIFNLKLKDITCDCRLIRKAVFDRIKLESNSGAICVEMMKKIQDAGFVIVETPVQHYPRRYGRSQFFTFSNLFKMIVELVKLWQEEFKKNGAMNDPLC